LPAEAASSAKDSWHSIRIILLFALHYFVMLCGSIRDDNNNSSNQSEYDVP
jgi:hypothetical protein